MVLNFRLAFRPSNELKNFAFMNPLYGSDKDDGNNHCHRDNIVQVVRYMEK